ncbi:MAG: hypothetical protein JRJ87_20525 [Deltaproteobacteria bacterium]|nr:hypothetical protein [Deltaproteobacteria bacterium]
MSKYFVIAWICIAPFAFAAQTPNHYVFPGGIVDVKRNLIYVTSSGKSFPPPHAVSYLVDGRGDWYHAHESTPAISALRLTSGKKVWTSKNILVPMHLYKNKLVAYAPCKNKVCFAVLDVRSGKILKRFETDLRVSKPKDQGCWASSHTNSKWWGNAKNFYYNYHRSSCPKRRPQGIRLTGEQVAQRMAECSRYDRALKIDLNTLKLAESDQTKAGSPHETGTLVRQDLGNMIVKVDTKCIKGAYQCRERKVILKHFKPDGQTLIKEKVLIEKVKNETTRLSADGKHVFIPIRTSNDTKDLRIFNSRSGKELRKKPYKIPEKYSFTAHLLVGGTLIGTAGYGNLGLRLRDLKRLWHISAPLQVPRPRCQPIP